MTSRLNSGANEGGEMPIHVTSRSVWIGFALAATVLSAPVGAQQTQSSNQAPSTVPQTEKEKKEKKERLEEVIVTGTDIRLDVSEVAALPLTILSANDITKQGPQEISTILRESPAFSGGTLNGGSGGFFSGAVETLNLKVTGIDHIGIGSDFFDVAGDSMAIGLEDVTRYPYCSPSSCGAGTRTTMC